MIHKHRSNRRRVALAKSKRKANIIKHVYGEHHEGSVLKLSKSKIHCSCPLCSAKTKRNQGLRDRSIKSWKASDRRKIEWAEDYIRNYEEAIV